MRHSACFLLSLLLSTSLMAEPAIDVASKDETAPSFYIEEILVEGHRHVSPGIVVAESLLKTGSSYTEDELREAIYRIKRLPFLLGVDFELRKGSERDRYILVISVLETTRFFYAFDFRLSYLLDPSDYPLARDRSDSTGDFLVGYRYFVGNQGLVYLTAGDIGLQFGYSSYNFLNRNVFLNVSLERDALCCDDPRSPGGEFQVLVDGNVDTLRFSVGIPRSARQLWRISGVHRRHDGNSKVFLTETDVERTHRDIRSSELQFAWIYDTTDDPVFPRRGDEFMVSFDLQSEDSRVTDVTDPTTSERHEPRTRTRSRSAAVTLTGRRHYPIGRRQSLKAGFSLSAGTFESEFDVEGVRFVDSQSDGWGGQASLVHAVDLLGAKRSRPQRRLRWENGVEYDYSSLSGNDLRPDYEYSQAAFRSELVYRSRWGVVRFSVRLIDVLEQT